jgi:hypothetical protein
MSPKVTKHTRCLFTPEPKAEEVCFVRESGKPVAKVACELDLTSTSCGHEGTRQRLTRGRRPGCVHHGGACRVDQAASGRAYPRSGA